MPKRPAGTDSGAMENTAVQLSLLIGLVGYLMMAAGVGKRRLEWKRRKRR
jgi:hypothetical protein